MLGVRRSTTVRAKTLLICYTLSSEQLAKAMNDFPFVRDYIMIIARKRLSRIKRFSALAHVGNRAALDAETSKRSNRDEEDSQTESVLVAMRPPPMAQPSR
jgi:hypothetical protein